MPASSAASPRPANVVVFIDFLLTKPAPALAALAAGQTILPRRKTPTIEALFPAEGNGFAPR